MKNLLTAILFATAMVGVSFAQGQTKTSGKTRIAVVEFTPGPNASAMTAEAKRHLQASIAFSLFETKKFDVVDVRNTRSASQADLAAINGGSTSAALPGCKPPWVFSRPPRDRPPYNLAGSAIMKPRFVEVATGKVKYSSDISQKSTAAMTARAGEAEMMVKVLKPAIQKLTADLSIF